MTLRIYSWFRTQESHRVVLRGSYVVLEIEPGLGNLTPSSVIFLQPLFIFLFFVGGGRGRPYNAQEGQCFVLWSCS